MKIDRYNKLIKSLGKHTAVGISGLDGAGKTTFAKELLESLKAEGLDPLLLHIDDFNNRVVQKRIYDTYMRGVFTEKHFETYYRESIEYEAVAAVIAEAKSNGLVIVEGVFLFKPQLNHLFDLRFEIDTSPTTARARFVKRKEEVGDPRPVEVFDDIWLPAFLRYQAEYSSSFDIDVVIKND
ncbi:AAA family ATPase [Kordiimonas laminariae]|uniref:AAA family ATPase n=1 Tax=Kordiimonas laminariae TaxID=2917717 RepID=UPI001FF58563|nr:AAA family ATPase [Kordiimonas laminariae]MCK0069971.1 hypothetical protein [Kordiimonas laminariae]